VDICVAVDGSPSSLLAVRWAAAEARRRRCGVAVLHVAPRLRDPRFLRLLAARRGGLPRRVLAEAVRCVSETAADVAVDRLLEHGRAAREILRVARDCRLLVLGAPTGRGAVVDEVAGHAPQPVVVVHPNAPGGSDPVVVGLGDPARDGAAVRFGYEDAARRGVPLEVVRIADPDTGRPLTGADRAELAQQVDALLARTGANPESGSVHVRLVPGDPADVLVDLSVRASLVVLARRHPPHLPGAGDVRRKVLRQAPSVVAVVPAGAAAS
jgi:nucleotide-binding universal stress UspA family protein